MPYGDRTGPRGRGPRTGRRAGFCAGYPVPGFRNPDVPGFGRGRGFGRGFGRGYGRGFGRGWGRGPGFGRGRGFGRYRWRDEPGPVDRYYDSMDYYDPGPEPELSEEDEKNYLEKLAEHLDNELKEIKNRLKELSGKKEK